MIPWIKIEDELPPIHLKVFLLTRVDKHIYDGFSLYAKDTFGTSCDSCSLLLTSDITHWAHINFPEEG